MDVRSQQLIEDFGDTLVVNKAGPYPEDDAEDHTHRTDEMSDDSTDRDEHKHTDDDDSEDDTSVHDESWNPTVELSSLELSGSAQTPSLVVESVSVPSILKRTLSEPLHLKDSKRVWKCLPKPNIDVLSRSQSTPLVSSSERKAKDCRVQFDKIRVRSYQQTLGDNPSVSYGPPIQLDWDYEEHDDIDLDEYEDNHPPRRNLRQMVLSYYHRKNVLQWQYGYTEEVLKKAKKQAERIKLKRSITNTLLPAMVIETAIESAGRKAKRLVGRSA